MSRYIIIGAGLAGLASAVWLAKKGVAVSLYESSAHAGGRCRSWYDDILGCEIDNGNHLMLGANANTARYAEWISEHTKHGLKATFGPIEIVNLNTQTRFTLAHRRPIQGVSLLSQLRLLKLMLAPSGRTVASFFTKDTYFYHNVVYPLCVSALNTDPADASATLFAKVLWEWLRGNSTHGEYRLASTTLGDALIQGAIKTIEAAGGKIHFQAALKHIHTDAQRVTGLTFNDETIAVDDGTRIILAIPPWGLEKIHDSLRVSLGAHPIVNGHFKLAAPLASTPPCGFIGLTGGTAHWLFFKEGLISTTTSAADDMLGFDHNTIAQRLWSDIRSLFPQLQETMPLHRIIIEKRATFSATIENQAKRPQPHTSFANLLLAGDYTQTHLPATIESAITSGFLAASLAYTK